MEILDPNANALTSPISTNNLIPAADENTRLQFEELCQSIQDNETSMKISYLNIGRDLVRIHEIFVKCCRDVGININEHFEQFIEQRFEKKKSWAYNAMSSYRRFSGYDQLQTFGPSIFQTIAPLNDTEFQLVLKKIEASIDNGNQLTSTEIKELVGILRDQRSTTYNNSDDQLADLEQQLLSKDKKIQLALNEAREKDDQIKQKTELNDALSSRLRAAQESNRNDSVAKQNEIELLKQQEQSLRDQIARLEKEKSTSVEVEHTDVPPGFTTIEEAILVKRDELEEITKQANSLRLSLKQGEEVIKEINAVFSQSCAITSAISTLINNVSKKEIAIHNDVIRQISQNLLSASKIIELSNA